MRQFPYELLNEIGFFVISAIHQVVHFSSFVGIAIFNFAPQSDSFFQRPTIKSVDGADNLACLWSLPFNENPCALLRIMVLTAKPLI